ncbi:hypothetical protein GCM10011491_08500 [Brucella endophytica]|uniref:Rieske domain-containing protein n=1 Tax=Brucella endophytica TaxID=1963359 RepID=A0A916S551_9HYPH|nr:aromatic ring-hydroxylating dioxygenase subunit alpha [Brucella endophytica]GGA83342.1 hypothetical protein GCM10011491_08500 [Brucella endophytica]
MKHETQVETLRLLLGLRKEERHQDMLGQVTQIPVRNYTDDATFEHEMGTVFRQYPTVAGHACHVREPGSFLLSDWDRFPYVVIRDKEGQLRAFLNICRHRGARLITRATENKKLKAFVCPFHGWVYDLDGSLRAITKEHNFPHLDRRRFGLVELPVAEQGGLIWIHPTPGTMIDLKSYLGPIADDMDHFGIDRLVSYRKSVIIKNANWKLLLKTYLEGYHVPFLHRTTIATSFRKGVLAHFEHGPHIRIAAARTNILDALNVEPEKWRILDYASVYYTLFPNTFFIMHPDYVSINKFYPEAPDRTIWTHEMLYREELFNDREELFNGEKGEAALAKRFEYTNDMVFDLEDFAVAEDVQKGLRFGGNEFHTLGLEEGLLAVFQQSVDQALNRSSVTPMTEHEGP